MHHFLKLRIFTITICCAFCISNSLAQDNVITLKALPGGSEGNSLFTDKSAIYITPSGTAVYKDSNQFDDWSVTSGNIMPSNSFDKTFELNIGGMSSVNLKEGKEYGSIISEGGIDRASNGYIGVRGGDGNGIGVNEGIFFGLDLSKMNASISIQITKLHIAFAGASNEKGVIVSKINPQQRITFGTAPGVDIVVDNEENEIDLTSLNIYITDRVFNNDLISVFNDSPEAGNFRVASISVKILDNNLDASKVTALQHPRLLLKKGEEAKIQTLINQSPYFKDLHDYIILKADEYLTSPDLVRPNSDRMLGVSRDAIFQIFYLSYAYRMTNNSNYLNKAEGVLNTVSDFSDWINYTLDTAEMCFAVAIGYDWLYDDLKESTKQNVREAILNHALIPETNKNFWEHTSNWNQVGIGGLSFGAMAILGDGTSNMDTHAANYLNRILIENPKSMNTYASGNYQEGAMYWSYGTTYEVMLLSALEGIFGEEHEGVKRLVYTPGFLESAEFMQYVTGPTSLYFNYMDSTQKRTPLPATFWMSKRSNNNSLLSEEIKLVKNGSYFTTSIFETRFLPITLIYGKDADIANISEPQKKVWVGYGSQPVTMVRTNWQGSNGKYVGIKAGTPTYSHGQMDGGAFVYDAQGLRWSLDFGKYDYEAVSNYLENLNPPQSSNDFSQNSPRWDIFRVSNLSHNTISIKKSSENNWQRHKADGLATLDEVFDTNEKRGAKVNLTPVIGLNNELQSITRSTYIVDEDYLEIKDELQNKSQAIDVYWNMATTAIVEQMSTSSIKLTQGGKTVVVEFLSSNANVTINLDTNRSTDPVDYNATATYERKNDGIVMIGFTATLPANENVTFTTTIKDGSEVSPTVNEPTNNILLELPSPNTGREGNFLQKDKSFFTIDNAGEVNISGFSTEYAWAVYGDTNVSDTFNNEFSFSWEAMGATNINEGDDYGALISEAGIDRSSAGELGIRGGNGNGIDPNEGYKLGLDITDIPYSASIQIVKIGVSLVGGSETGVVVNRKDTSKKITFGASGTQTDVRVSNGFINVESIDLSVNGGEKSDDIASIFNTSSSGSFRINSLVLKVSEATLSTTENLEAKLIIYPNPFKDTINISNINMVDSELKYKIFDIKGSKIIHRTQAINSTNVTIKTNSLQAGIYFLQIKQGGKITNKKIIKN